MIQQLYSDIVLASEDNLGDRLVLWPGGHGALYLDCSEPTGTVRVSCGGFRHVNMGGVRIVGGSSGTTWPVATSPIELNASGVAYFWAPAGAEVIFSCAADEGGSVEIRSVYVASL